MTRECYTPSAGERVVGGLSVALVVAIVALSCGDRSSEAGGAAESTPLELDTATSTGLVHKVDMLLTGDGRYVYRPDTLRIRRGDAVRWIMVSGPPHNVSFYAERVPRGGERFLRTAMPRERKISPLGGRVMSEIGDSFEISFAGAPLGEYDYFCVPHEVVGMKGAIVVEEPPVGSGR
ncbi:MAG: plastocyanin/azurin family copper-binding protein [Gemmatimonadales bacterium]